MGEGPYTVFAPTNKAFAKLDADTRANLMSGDYNEELEQILKAHVVSGKYLKSDLPAEGAEIETIGESILTIDFDEAGDVRASEAAVVAADIKTKNGVIHVIDDVIVPEGVFEVETGTLLENVAQ